MTFEEMVLASLSEIRATQYTEAGMLLILLIFNLVLAVRADVFQGLINYETIKRRFNLAVKAKNKLTTKLVNYGNVKPIPDIPPYIELRYAQEQLSNGCQFFSEQLWLVDKLFINLGDGFTPEMFRKIHDKWGAENILKRKNGKKRGAWIPANTHGRTVVLIQNKVKVLSPSVHESNRKLQELTG